MSNRAIAVTITLIVVAFSFGLTQFFFPFGNNQNSSMKDQNAQVPDSQNPFEAIGRQDVVIGTGAEAVPGKTVFVHYTGKLLDGTVFDSSVGKQPLRFVLGAGQLIPGFEIGVFGMKVGGKRTITIPPEFGYGSRDQGPIPGNSTLIFDLELVKVE